MGRGNSTLIKTLKYLLTLHDDQRLYSNISIVLPIFISKYFSFNLMLPPVQNGASPTHDTHETSPLKSNLKTNGGGQVDYKKVSINLLLIQNINNNNCLFQLWEESQEENSRLRSEMEATRQDLDSTRQQLDSAIQVNSTVQQTLKF